VRKEPPQLVHSIHELSIEIIDLRLTVFQVLSFCNLGSFLLFSNNGALFACILRLRHASVAFQLARLRQLHALLALGFTLRSRCGASSCAQKSFQAAPSTHTVPLWTMAPIGQLSES